MQHYYSFYPPLTLDLIFYFLALLNNDIAIFILISGKS